MRTSRASHTGTTQRILAAAAVVCLLSVLAALVLDTRRAPLDRSGPATGLTGTSRGAPLLLATRTAARLPAHAGAAAADLEQATPPRGRRDPSRWGEREHYEHFLALPADDLAAAAGPLLRGDDPDCAKVALLRALDETNPAAAAPWFAWVLREVPDETELAGVSVPAFVVRRLSAALPDDATARDLLMDATFGARRMAPSLRGRAASALAGSASEHELALLSTNLHTERDPLVRAGALQALRSNPDQEAVRRWFAPSETTSDATFNPRSDS